MNAELLLKHFHQLGDAADAVPRFRRYILDLAVRGKLVEQIASDGSALSLIESINARKKDLVAKGVISKSELKLDQETVGPPFQLPKSWKWIGATYPTYTLSDRGKKILTKDVLEEGKYPVVDQGKVFIRGFCNDRDKVIHVREPLIIFGDHTRETKLIDFDFVVGADGVKLLQPICIHPVYYYKALQWLPLDTRGYGRHFKLLRASLIPLPPLAEQKRIVAKVDELMVLCDQLEAAQKEREERRSRLTAATWQSLTTSGTKRETAFALEQLPQLTARPQQIAALRQTILDLAVRGKLVNQDPRDEPAEVLLKRIHSEREQLVKAKKIRRYESFGPVPVDILSFDIPESWKWCYLGDVCFLITDGAHHTPKYLEEGVPFLSVKDVSGGVIDFSSTRYISEEAHKELCKRCMPELGDILLTKVGTTGIAVRIDVQREFSIFVSLALLKFSQRNLDGRYLQHLINSPFVKHQSATNTQGIGNKNLVLRLINRFTVPIPPLAEQKRIVAKVDELMRLCAELEATLQQGVELQGKALEALLRLEDGVMEPVSV